jgi:hypothetical protein
MMIYLERVHSELGVLNTEEYLSYSTTVPLNLKVSSSSELLNFSVAAGGTFMLSTSEITGSVTNTFTYDDIMSVSVEPYSGSAKVEYFIATT